METKKLGLVARFVDWKNQHGNSAKTKKAGEHDKYEGRDFPLSPEASDAIRSQMLVSTDKPSCQFENADNQTSKQPVDKKALREAAHELCVTKYMFVGDKAELMQKESVFEKAILNQIKNEDEEIKKYSKEIASIESAVVNDGYNEKYAIEAIAQNEARINDAQIRRQFLIRLQESESLIIKMIYDLDNSNYNNFPDAVSPSEHYPSPSEHYLSPSEHDPSPFEHENPPIDNGYSCANNEGGSCGNDGGGNQG